MSYQRLIDDHDEIDRLANALVVLAESGVPDVTRALDLLWDLSGAVNDHLTYEDRTVYSRLIQSKHPQLSSAGVDFEASFIELRSDWQTYLSDWQAETLACDWPLFASETIAMMLRLRQRVSDETSLIYPLALQQSFIRLRVRHNSMASLNLKATVRVAGRELSASR